MKRYICPKCKKIVLRDSNKKRLLSYCREYDCNVRLKRVDKNSKKHWRIKMPKIKINYGLAYVGSRLVFVFWGISLGLFFGSGGVKGAYSFIIMSVIVFCYGISRIFMEVKSE